MTYGYINKSTVGTEEATIVKTYLEREGFTEWFAKKVKAYRSSQKKQEILNKLRNIVNEDNSSSNSSDNNSWQQVDMSPPGNSVENGEVCLTEENIPYVAADRLTVCKICNNLTHDHCNVIGHQAGDLVCPNVRFKFYPVNIRWKAYEESFPKANWISEEQKKPKVKRTPATSSGINPPKPAVQIPAAVSGINPEEKILLLADEFLTKNSILTFEQRQAIIGSVDIVGMEPRQAKSVFESVEKAMIIQQKGYGLRQDGSVRLKAPTSFDRYYETVKTLQSRKEAIESFRRQNEATQAQQADRIRELQSKRLNLNTVSKEDFEIVMPNLPKPTVNQIFQARSKGSFADWKAVSGIHGVGEKVLQNMKVYFDTPGTLVPEAQEGEEPMRSGKRSHQVYIATTETRQVLLTRQKLKLGKL